MPEDSVEQPEAKLPTCNICNKSFPHKNSLRQHLEQAKHAFTSDPGEEVAKRLRCTMCTRSFNKEYWLRKHMWTKHVSKVPASVKPAEDAKPSPSSQNPAVDSDVPIQQEDLKQEDQDQDSVPTVFSCPVCSKTFNGQFGLDQHTEANHNSKPQEGRINCKLCRKSFVDGSALQQHHRDTHNQKEKTSKPSPQRFKCDFCNSIFHHFDLLEQHVIRHNLWSDDGPVVIYKCDFCPKTFYSYDELDEHMRTTYRFNSPNSWDSDGQTDEEEDYEEDYEDSEESEEESDGEDYDESNENEAGESDEENNEESDEENDEESNEGNEESDKESVPDLVETTGKTSGEKLAAELPPPPFKCQDCDEAFYYTAALGEHQEMFAHGPMATREKKPEPVAEPPAHEFKCRDCDEAFHHFIMLLEHQEKAGHGPLMKSVEKPVEKPAEKPTIEDKAGDASVSVYKCTDCGWLYREVNSFQTHLAWNHGRRSTYPNKHLTKVSPQEADAPAKKVTSGFRCKPCNEPFRNQYLLATHWRKTHEDAWWALFDKYNISDESISYSDFQNFDDYNEDDMLDDLRQINSWSSKKENMVPCITCWKKFRTSSQMVEHVEMRECHSYIAAHSIKWAVHRSDQSVVSGCYSDGKFQCPDCEARFDRLSSLLRHAERNECHADVAQGPIKAFMKEMKWRMIEGELI
ncbi:hypothetical protein J7337_001674 [Fusarium musae]|uniref:C2H2-type domain-containing protein n=1 Tax=Fusarium musae TaxID=1042133 RepID=A0A9P8DU84_9HYPO|nr:hypothetical protein J7337_001674 [Fusarium musae]KAG9508113.1 hypothetical protein J7337_001674 [Fusarium musae]